MLEVLPGLFMNSHTDDYRAYAKLPCKGFGAIRPALAAVSTSYFSNQLICQLGSTVRLSLVISSATLAVAIGVIVASGPQKQVSRIDARRVVAMVAYANVRRNRSVVQYPRVTVGSHATTINSDLSVSTLNCPTSPYPALVKCWMVRPVLVDFLPETINGGLTTQNATALETTCLLLLPIGIRCASFDEYSAAYQAGFEFDVCSMIRSHDALFLETGCCGQVRVGVASAARTAIY